MSTMIPNTFSSYSFTPEEEIQARLLSTLQKQNIQNQISMVATNVLNLEYDVQNPLKFAQDEAFLKGQIQVLTYLLDSSDSAESMFSGQDQPQQ